MINKAAVRAEAVRRLLVARRNALALLSFMASGLFLGIVFMLAGGLLAMAGVFVLWGGGWALLVGALPLLTIGFLMLRGVFDGK